MKTYKPYVSLSSSINGGFIVSQSVALSFQAQLAWKLIENVTHFTLDKPEVSPEKLVGWAFGVAEEFTRWCEITDQFAQIPDPFRKEEEE